MKGHRVRTKNEMSRMLGDAYDLTAFDFQTGKINPLLLRSAQPSQRSGSSSSSSGVNANSSSSRNAHKVTNSHSSSSSHSGANASRSASNTQSSKDSNSVGAAGKSGNSALGIRNDSTLVPPIRQTASIFKQPVTVKKNTRVSK